jgi:ADP-heptose:LPS heptosyltransferase
MSDIIFVGGDKKVKVKSNDLSLRDFYNRRNKVLILRDSGGLGDILMMRMIFEDFKKIMPDAHITFAIPTTYTRAAFWHPYIDEIANSKVVNENDYGVSYNVTTACVRYEMKIRPRSDRHRSEIWTAYCGVKLTSPNMHLNVPTIIKKCTEKKFKEKVPNRGNGYVCFAPISNMVSKDLDLDQIKGVLRGVRNMGFTPYILHNKQIDGKLDCPVLAAPLDQWIALVELADYVIAVDTATFHASYGLNKPTVGIFSWADGKTYGKFHNKCIMVQRHRDHTPGWTCGPCYDHPNCPRTKDPRKPCITEITVEEVLDAFARLVKSYPLSDVVAHSDHTHPPSSETLDNCRTDDRGLTDTQSSKSRILELPTL